LPSRRARDRARTTHTTGRSVAHPVVARPTRRCNPRRAPGHRDSFAAMSIRLAARVADLAAEVAQLRETVDIALAQQPPPSPTREAGRCWRALTASQALHVWPELIDWVDAL